MQEAREGQRPILLVHDPRRVPLHGHVHAHVGPLHSVVIILAHLAPRAPPLRDGVTYESDR